MIVSPYNALLVSPDGTPERIVRVTDMTELPRNGALMCYFSTVSGVAKEAAPLKNLIRTRELEEALRLSQGKAVVVSGHTLPREAVQNALAEIDTLEA